LTMTLNPPEAQGRWRFPWETAWRPSSTATNLLPDNYSVIFLERVGWQTPKPTTNVVSGGFNESVTNTYISVDDAANGALVVTLHPSAVATNGQWRPMENPSRPWLDSRTTITNVSPSPLPIEFKDVAGYATPGATNVNIVSGQAVTFDATYLL